MNAKNKLYVKIFIGVVVLIIIFASIVFWEQAPQKNVSPSSSQKSGAINNSQVAQANVPTLSLPPLANTPAEATKQFYQYYFSSVKDPLANGAFEKSPYLSDVFKGVIKSLYNNGSDPVFCPQNKTANIVVGHEQTFYYNNAYLTEEVISDASSGNKELYSVLLQQNNGKWQIVDINCM